MKLTYRYFEGRGLRIIEFRDRYDCECSLQESSLATEAAIWFGTKHADPRRLVPGQGWQSVPFPEETMFNTRMHLTQDQVRALLPALQRFAKTGCLPDGDE